MSTTLPTIDHPVVGLVGLGYIASFHARGLRAALPGVEIIGVDPVDAARDAAVGSGMVDRAVASVDELLATGPAAAHVLTPPQLHHDVTAALLRAGVDVLIEKPYAHRLDEAADLTATAAASGALVAVSHNQLFYPVWERSRASIAAEDIGRLCSLDVDAARPLGFLRAPDTRPWLMRGATNILFEVAPHAFAQVLDVLPTATVDVVRVSSPQDLPNGVRFWRRWDILGNAGDVAVRVCLSYEDAAARSTVFARGTLSSLEVDFDHNTDVRRTRSFTPFDVEPFAQSTAAAWSLVKGATSTLAGVVAGKAGLPGRGDPFASSIASSIATFHAGRRGRIVDARHAPALGEAVVRFAAAVAAASGLDAVAHPTPTAARNAEAPGATTSASQDEGRSERPTTLVVGGTGFIGERLVRRLAADGPVSVVARRPDAARAQFAGLAVHVVAGDVRSPDSILAAVQPGDVVYHLAFGGGTTWDELQQVDVAPTLAIARGCAERGVARFVYTSTIAIYDAGHEGEVIDETTPPSREVLRAAPYARAKAYVEQQLLEMRSAGLPLVIARPGIVLGLDSDPCHWGVAAWRHPNVAIHWGSGDHPLPIVLVEDVAEALARMGTVPGIEGESFNLCAPASITAEDYLTELERASHSPVRRRPKSTTAAYLNALATWFVKLPSSSRAPFPSYRDLAGRSFAARFDCSKAERVLGWRPVAEHDELLRRGVTEPARAWRR